MALEQVPNPVPEAFYSSRATVVVVTAFFLVFHTGSLFIATRNLFLNQAKVKTNEGINPEAQAVYRTSSFLYASRASINVLNMLVEIMVIIACCKACNGPVKSKSHLSFIRCCTDVRDATSMLIGSTLVLSTLAYYCRLIELYYLCFSKYDTVEFQSIKQNIVGKGSLSNPEYNAHLISTYVAVAVIYGLMVGFKGLVVSKIYEDYCTFCAVMAPRRFLLVHPMLAGAAAVPHQPPGVGSPAGAPQVPALAGGPAPHYAEAQPRVPVYYVNIPAGLRPRTPWQQAPAT